MIGDDDEAIGDVTEARSDHDREISDATEAISLKPDYGCAHYFRGNAYFSKADFGKALTDFRAAAQFFGAADPRHDRTLARIDEAEEKLGGTAPAHPF
jgi:hypothetical protein